MVDLEQSTIQSEKHWASVFQSLSYSVDVCCQPLHVYGLHISYFLLTDCIIVMVRIVQRNHVDVCSSCSISRRMLVLATPSLRWSVTSARNWSWGLLGCDTISCCGRIPTFRRTLLHQSSAFVEDACSEVLRNVGNLPKHYTVSQTGRPPIPHVFVRLYIPRIQTGQPLRRKNFVVSHLHATETASGSLLKNRRQSEIDMSS